MAIEIERKFLVRTDDWRADADQGIRIRQGYLVMSGNSSVRVRIAGDQANLNIKSASLTVRRAEYEYRIPLPDAEEMLATMCSDGWIEKTRYHIPFQGHVWEVDVFAGDNHGMVVAEIELEQEDESFQKPDWAGQEVSNDHRYYNVNLISHPYKNW